MTDLIFIKGFTVIAIIGIAAEERVTPQPIHFDIELATDAARAARTERIADALDYVQVCAIVSQTAQEGRFQLVETLAERIAERLLAELSVRWLKLRVGKPTAVAGATAVGVQIERGTRSA